MVKNLSLHRTGFKNFQEVAVYESETSEAIEVSQNIVEELKDEVDNDPISKGLSQQNDPIPDSINTNLNNLNESN